MVPAERLGSFYEMIGQWLSRDGSDSVTPDFDVKLSESHLHPWTDQRVQRWTMEGSREERIGLARQLLRELSPRARAFYLHLLEKDGFEAPAIDIVGALGLESTRALAGTLSSFGTVTRRINKSLPFEWRVEPDGATVYSIDPEIADVFQAALAVDSRPR